MQKPVRKAVIPVAGLGTRLLPVTKSVPKELLPIVDIPAIQVIVEECVNSGIEEVIFITGRGKGGIEDHFDYSYELEKILEERGKTRELKVVRKVGQMIRTVAVRQKKPLGLGHAILQAKDVVGDEPFLVLLPDDIIDAHPSVTRQVLDVYEKYGQGVVSIMEVPEDEVNRYGIIHGENWAPRLHRIRQLVEKPIPGVAPTNLAVMGRYVLPPVIFDYLSEIFDAMTEAERDATGEVQLTDALARLAREKALIGYEFEGVRHDTGDRLGFITANIAYALRRPELKEKLWAYINSLEQE